MWEVKNTANGGFISFTGTESSLSISKTEVQGK